MKNKILKFFKKFNIADIFVMSGGTAIAQAIAIVSQPLVTRLYSPDQFGTLSLINEFVAMFSTCACLQYELTIITAPSEKEANHTTGMCFFLLLCTSLIFSLFVFLYNLINPETAQNTGGFLYLSIILYLFVGLATIVSSYNKRQREYKLMSSVSVFNSLLNTVSKLLLGWLNAGSFGLFFSNLLTHIGGIYIQAKTIIANRKEIFSARFSDFKRLMKKNISQPLYYMPSMFISSYAYSVIPFYMTTLYGSLTDTGLYSQATLILVLPLTIIGNNISTVFFTNATREYNETGSYRKSLRKATLLLSAVAIPAYLAIFIFAPWAFGFFFGERWARSGDFARILCFWHMIRFTATSIDCSLIIEKKQNVGFISRIFLLAISISIFIICKVLVLPIETFLLITSIAYGLFYFAIILLVYKYACKKNKAVSE